jgi:DNA repair exonuclease SbcCD ATPase subunit
MITALDPSKGVVECPTCSTPVADLEMDIEYAKADVVKLNAEIEARYQVQAASMEYHTVLNRYEEWKMGWEARQEDLLEQADVTVDADAPLTEAELADAVETKERYEEWQVARAGAIDELRNVGQSIASREGVLASKTRARGTLEERIAAYESEGITDEAATEARMVLPGRQAQYAERLQLEGQLSALTSNLEIRQADLAQAELRINESQRLVAFAAHLRDVRDTLHRDNLPRVVARNYLELLQESINAILESFATDYRVVATESLGFDACFLDGRVQQVPRLSGGQKVVLALAFRISINALFAADLGLLCLDEPTAYLDDENLACLDVALERLRALSESRGLQCILITHERGLEHLFDKVIQL